MRNLTNYVNELLGGQGSGLMALVTNSIGNRAQVDREITKLCDPWGIDGKWIDLFDIYD